MQAVCAANIELCFLNILVYHLKRPLVKSENKNVPVLFHSSSSSSDENHIMSVVNLAEAPVLFLVNATCFCLR